MEHRGNMKQKITLKFGPVAWNIYNAFMTAAVPKYLATDSIPINLGKTSKVRWLFRATACLFSSFTLGIL